MAQDELTQLQNVMKHYSACKQDGRVMCWANYELPDSLWAGWATGFLRYEDNAFHPLAAKWKSL